jgi:hypothetical protein
MATMPEIVQRYQPRLLHLALELWGRGVAKSIPWVVSRQSRSLSCSPPYASLEHNQDEIGKPPSTAPRRG